MANSVIYVKVQIMLVEEKALQRENVHMNLSVPTNRNGTIKEKYK